MKYAFIETHKTTFRISRMCRVLRVSRSGYYSWCSRRPSQRDQENARLTEAMVKLHRESRQTYGGRKLWKGLLLKGFACGRHRVDRLRREAGLESRRRKRFRRAYETRNAAPPAPNHLAQQFSVQAPNRVWLGDMTFIPTRRGWLYLTALLDLYSRKVVGWAMGERPSGQLVRDALEMALQHRRPGPGLVHHSDQGSQYRAADYLRRLENIGAVPSMSRKGNCYDNAVAESFFSTLKSELVFHRDYRTREEARADIFEFIEVFYNRQRLHQTLDYRTPFQFEQMADVA